MSTRRNENGTQHPTCNKNTIDDCQALGSHWAGLWWLGGSHGMESGSKGDNNGIKYSRGMSSLFGKEIGTNSGKDRKDHSRTSFPCSHRRTQICRQTRQQQSRSHVGGKMREAEREGVKIEQWVMTIAPQRVPRAPMWRAIASLCLGGLTELLDHRHRGCLLLHTLEHF